MLQHPPAGIESGKKLGREVLAQYMHTFDELAEQYRKADETKFRQYAELAVACAKALAPYRIADLPRRRHDLATTERRQRREGSHEGRVGAAARGTRFSYEHFWNRCPSSGARGSGRGRWIC